MGLISVQLLMNLSLINQATSAILSRCHGMQSFRSQQQVAAWVFSDGEASEGGGDAVVVLR